MLALDFGVFHRKAHIVKVKSALLEASFWIGLAFIFNIGVYFSRGSKPALEFLTCYIIEESLSVDNLFVFLIIFSYFMVPLSYRHKALFWGIAGAIIMRMLFIVSGVALIHKLHWVLYIFGAFLLFTGVKLAFSRGVEVHPEKNPILKLVRKIVPVASSYANGSFFIKEGGKTFATPLFVVILAIISFDLVFALDSIPAALGISTNSFIVFTSNAFAVLGLRSLFFAIASIMELFEYLHYGLAAVLSFIGVKMLISDFYEMPIWAALSVVASILLVSIVVSVILKEKRIQS